MGRKEARQAAMQLLYEREEGGVADAYSLALCYALLSGKDEDQAMMEPAQQGAADDAAEPAAEGAVQDARWLHTVEKGDRAYIDRVLNAMPDEIARIDELIARHSQGWTIDRMPRVDLTILRLAVLEMTRMSDIPDRVAIDEALELAAKYSEPKSGRFINGVLGAIWRETHKRAGDGEDADGAADGLCAAEADGADGLASEADGADGADGADALCADGANSVSSMES